MTGYEFTVDTARSCVTFSSTREVQCLLASSAICATGAMLTCYVITDGDGGQRLFRSDSAVQLVEGDTTFSPCDAATQQAMLNLPECT